VNRWEVIVLTIEDINLYELEVKLEKSIKKKDAGHEYKENVLWLSELPYCHRKSYICRKFNLSPTLNGKMLSGIMFHERLDRILKSMPEFSDAKFEVECKADIGEFTIGGRADVVNGDNVYEFKFSSSRLDGALPLYYIIQGNAYANMLGLSKYTLSFVNSFSLKPTLLQFDADKELFEKMIDDAKILYKCIKEDVLPAGPKWDWECLHPTTLIHTKKGLEEIKNVNVGDMVMTSKGFKKIVKKIKNKLGNRTMFRLKPHKLMPLLITDNHKIKIGKLTYKYNGSVGKKTITPCWLTPQEIKDKKDKYYIEFNFPKNNMDVAELNNNKLRLLGYYIAEGCYKSWNGYRSGLVLTINPNENKMAEDIKKIAKKEFGCNSEDRIRNDSRGKKMRSYRQIRVNGRKIVRFIEKYVVGNMSYNKYFINNLLALPIKKQKVLTSAMMLGDGCESESNTHGTKYFTYVTTSKNLAFQYFMMCLRQSKLPSLIKTDVKDISFNIGGIKSKHDQYRVQYSNADIGCGIIKGNKYYVNISSIEQYDYSGDVYNLSVDGIPEYQTVSGLVHNCRYCDFKEKCKELQMKK
jgi:hypothetical protein